MPDDFTLTLLRKRGIETKEAIETFLNPSYDLHLHDPLLMKNMPEAARRLAQAILSGERVAIWSDYDCDGIPAGVLLHDFLKKAGANFENYIPHRHNEGYGVSVEGIEKLAESGAKLVVTADVGITDVEAIARARELDMEVIVTDHHLPGDMLPNAIVVDDKQAGETYPFPELCGAATAWKLVCATLAVEPKLREKVPEGWEKWLLDMAGLATIADMMPLVGENRVIAKYGLRVLRKSPRIGLQKLCRAMRVNQATLTEDDVGFMIAPRVNAASRMGDAWDAFHLFTTTDEAEAERLAKKLDKANRERKAHAGVITRAVHTRLKARESLPGVIVLGDPAWRPALLGLVANNISEEFERPVFLWGREGNNTLKGSCRSPGSVHVLELMGAAEGAFVEFGGHALSGGFSVKDDQIFNLEERLNEAHTKVANREVEQAAPIDLDIAPEQADESLLEKVERLAPFGEANPKPLFRLASCEIVRVAPFGKGNEHLKIVIAHGFGDLEAVAFFAKGEVAKAAQRLVRGARADIMGHLERDQFSRTRRPRLRLVSITAP